MPTKEELSSDINEMLDTDIEWNRLLEDDINEFYEMLNNGQLFEKTGKVMVKEHGKKMVEDEINGWRPGKYLGKVL